MCDCYTDRCRVCGKPIEMHLGDYDTERGEIYVLHEKCSNASFFIFANLRWVLWSSNEEGNIFVISITDNAWEKRNGNSPNVGGSEIINQKGETK